MKKELKALKNDLVFAVSLIGDREKQEDNLGMWTHGTASLLVVADVAGGQADGAAASALAVSIFEEVWRDRQQELLNNPS